MLGWRERGPCLPPKPVDPMQRRGAGQFGVVGLARRHLKATLLELQGPE